MALRTGLPLVFGELLFEQKCTVVVKNDFPRSHLHRVQYYVTDYIPDPLSLQSGSGNETNTNHCV